MNETLYLLLLYFVSLLFHEAGHYITFVLNGVRRPTIKLHWWGVTVGTEEQMNTLTLKEIVDVYLAGIVIGFCFLFFANVVWGVTSIVLTMAYFLSCFFDMSNLHQIISLLLKHPELKNLRLDAANVRLAKQTILLAKQKD